MSTTIIHEDGDKVLIIDPSTGEFTTTNKDGQIHSEQQSKLLRALRFYYLNVYRKHSRSRSLTFCHVTPVALSSKSKLTDNFISGRGNSNFKGKNFHDYDNFPTNSTKHIGHGSVHVFKGIASKKAHFHGVMKCSNVWACPVCSSRISVKRGIELSKATKIHSSNKGGLYLVTLTIPHSRDSVLDTLLNDLLDCYRSLTSGRIYQDIKSTYNIIGSVRALEVTYGDSNGWHPHLHILVFTSKYINIHDLKKDLFNRWITVTKNKSPLYIPKSASRMVDVQNGKHAALYVSKISDDLSSWTVSDELTKSHKKQAKQGRFSAHALLISFIENKNRYHLRKFQEYEKCFAGKNQLSWSKGLKAYFEIDEKSDEELNNEFDELSVHLASIPTDVWKIIASHNLFSEVLEQAENGSDSLQAFLHITSLKSKSKKFKKIEDKYSTSHDGNVDLYKKVKPVKPVKQIEHTSIFSHDEIKSINIARLSRKRKSLEQIKKNIIYD